MAIITKNDVHTLRLRFKGVYKIMKRTYSKPAIVFEDFALNTNIAASCNGQKINTLTQGTCGLPVTVFDTIFVLDVTGCSIKVEDGSSEANGYCYHNPSDLMSLFNS